MDCKQKIDGRVISYALGLSVVTASVILLTIIPQSRKLVSQNKEKRALEAVVEEHKALLPIYTELSVMLLEYSDFNSKPIETVASDMIPNVTSIFKGIANKYRLKHAIGVPQLKKVREHNVLIFDVLVVGELLNCRSFIVDAMNLSYIEGVEEIKIERKNGNSECAVKVHLALEG